MDNMNIRKINGFTVQLVADGVYAIDEFGIALMYLIIGKTQALLLDTGVGAGNVHAVVKELTDLPCLVVNSHHHYDHAGGNVWFDEVYAHKNAVSVLKEQNCQEVRRAFIERQLDREEYNGEASVADTISYLHEYRVNPIEEGKVFDLGGRKLEVIETFGHTKDGICLLDSENRLLFSGDSVVSTPTLITEPCKSDTMEHYAKALKHLEGREAEFDLIFPGHYVHPLPKTYLKELIVCAETILENPLYGTPEKNHMSDQIAYRAFYKKASILYTMDRVTGEKAPQE